MGLSKKKGEKKAVWDRKISHKEEKRSEPRKKKG